MNKKINKSLLTNVISIVLILIGYLILNAGQKENLGTVILTMGLYSFSGAITNWLAIHMLFEKVPFLYGSGIITERFSEFKLGIKNLIMNQFFTKENFEKFLGDNKKDLLAIEEDTILASIDFDKVFNKLKEAILESSFGAMLGMFGGSAALEPLRPQFEKKFQEILAEILADEKFLENFSKNSSSDNALLANVTELVDLRLNELTPLMVKNIIQDMIREHLGWLVVWGGVFGALIGLVTTWI